MRIVHPLVYLLADRVTPVPEIILYARHVCAMLPGNAWVTTTTIPISTVLADADALQAAQVQALTKGKGLAEARNHKLATLFTDLESLRGDCQKVIDANPAHAAEIAQSCGMSVKRASKRRKAQLAAKMTSAPGVGKLVAKAVKRGAGYEWEMSADGGKTWATVARSTVANTTVSGLVAGTIYMFRFRTTVGQVTSDWGDAISFLAF
jgi:hypothetical protein